MEFVIGFCGALTCLGVFGLGVASGWALRRLTDCPPPEAAYDDEPDDEEGDAFRRLQTYTVEDAYGQNRRPEEGYAYD